MTTPAGRRRKSRLGNGGGGEGMLSLRRPTEYRRFVMLPIWVAVVGPPLSTLTAAATVICLAPERDNRFFSMSPSIRRAHHF